MDRVRKGLAVGTSISLRILATGMVSVRVRQGHEIYPGEGWAGGGDDTPGVAGSPESGGGFK